MDCFRDKSVSGHSVTVRETITVTPAEIDGATAYEVSGVMILHFCYSIIQSSYKYLSFLELGYETILL